MKTKFLILSLAVATAFLSSSIPTGSHSLEIGKEAPDLTLSSLVQDSLESFKGRNVLVNFWSASDAASRIANKKLSELAANDNSDNCRYISVCIDNDQSLASEIASADAISDKVLSLSASDITPDVLSDFQVNTGCRSFSIDSYGNLAAINPLN